jgi:hypothetical protein
LRNQIRRARKQRPTVEWITEDRYEPNRDQPSRVAENIELHGDGTLHCRRCGETLRGAEGRVAIAERSLETAGPWMALRHGGNGPNFVLQEISCPSCATLLSVREVRRDGAGTG